MTAVRLVPVAPFVVVNLAAGAIGVRYWHFAVATMLGMVDSRVGGGPRPRKRHAAGLADYKGETAGGKS